MDHYDVKRLALVLSVQAEIEGMKAANQIKVSEGSVPQYNQSHFDSLANRLSDLAYAHNEQL